MAKRLHRASPKTGERRSLHKISAVLAAAGFLNERGKPHPRIDLGAPRGSGALAFRTNWRATAAQTQRQAYVWCNCRRDEVREGSRRARSWCLRLRLDQHRPASPKRTGQRTRLFRGGCACSTSWTSTLSRCPAGLASRAYANPSGSHAGGTSRSTPCGPSTESFSPTLERFRNWIARPSGKSQADLAEPT